MLASAFFVYEVFFIVFAIHDAATARSKAANAFFCRCAQKDSDNRRIEANERSQRQRNGSWRRLRWRRCEGSGGGGEERWKVARLRARASTLRFLLIRTAYALAVACCGYGPNFALARALALSQARQRTGGNPSAFATCTAMSQAFVTQQKRIAAAKKRSSSCAYRQEPRRIRRTLHVDAKQAKCKRSPAT